MSIIDIPVINSTLVSPRLIELRKQFMQNDIELLRREFEVYGVELSTEMLQLYVKTLIIYNANVTWDLKAISFRSMSMNYSTGVVAPAQNPISYLVPVGIKSIDPITLSFMTEVEAKKLIMDHYTSTFSFRSGVEWTSSLDKNIFDGGLGYMTPFSQLGYVQLEANYISKYGKLDQGYVDMCGTINILFNRRQSLFAAQWNKNQTLDPKTLIPAIRSMFSYNPYTSTGIPYKSYYDYENLYLATQTKYFEPFMKPLTGYENHAILFTRFITGYNATRSTLITNVDYTGEELQAAIRSFPYPTNDTRTEYQKMFTNDAATDPNAALRSDDIAKLYRQAQVIKGFVESKGGHKSVVTAFFNLIAEAHASVMTTVNVLTEDFVSQFTKSLVIKNAPSGAISEAYIFLDNNFKVYTQSSYKTYPLNSNGDEAQMISGMNIINVGSGIRSFKVMGPLDSTYPFYYYSFSASGSTPSHLVKASAILGLQSLRNGFLYQDIERNFEPTFVGFPPEAIEKLESLATKQMAMFDLLDDVKLKNIYSKQMSIQTPKQPFNPMMPEYVTSYSYIDMLKTEAGDIPLIHPECEFAIKWQALHVEFVLLSSFYYHQFMSAIKPTVDDYNNRVGNYIAAIIAEMKTLSGVYSAAEADKFNKEKESSALELQLEKLKTGVFIDDQGREYWRPMTPDEKAAVDKMILQIETNLAQADENERIKLQNERFVEDANAEVIRLNSTAQQRVDAEAVEANERLQAQADTEWLKVNVKDLKAPTMKDIADYADARGIMLSESIVAWQNEYPFYIYNIPLAQEIEVMRKKIHDAEVYAAETLVQAKINEINITKALKEIFKLV